MANEVRHLLIRLEASRMPEQPVNLLLNTRMMEWLANHMRHLNQHIRHRRHQEEQANPQNSIKYNLRHSLVKLNVDSLHVQVMIRHDILGVHVQFGLGPEQQLQVPLGRIVNVGFPSELDHHVCLLNEGHRLQ